MNKKTIAIIGGDTRQQYLADFLSKHFHVICYGVPLKENDFDTAQQCVFRAEVIVLPMPISRDCVTLNAPQCSGSVYLSELFDNIHCDSAVFGGLVKPQIAALAKQCHINLIDLLDDEPLTMDNAVLTAEGAIGVAVNESSDSLYKSQCAVCGYGRIAKILTHQLMAHGAKVSVFARNISCRSLANALGATALPFDKLSSSASQFQYIFNTVPSLVLDSEVLKNLSSDCTVIELASAPGGIDLDFAKKAEITVISAMSLPGKKSPKAAAKLIGTTILQKIKEENI